jgi:hypothetical protein
MKPAGKEIVVCKMNQGNIASSTNNDPSSSSIIIPNSNTSGNNSSAGGPSTAIAISNATGSSSTSKTSDLLRRTIDSRISKKGAKFGRGNTFKTKCHSRVLINGTVMDNPLPQSSFSFSGRLYKPPSSILTEAMKNDPFQTNNHYPPSVGDIATGSFNQFRVIDRNHHNPNMMNPIEVRCKQPVCLTQNYQYYNDDLFFFPDYLKNLTMLNRGVFIKTIGLYNGTDHTLETEGDIDKNKLYYISQKNGGAISTTQVSFASEGINPVPIVKRYINGFPYTDNPQVLTYPVARHVGFNIKENKQVRVYQLFQVILPPEYTIFEGKLTHHTPQPTLFFSNHITYGGIMKHPLGNVYLEAWNQPNSVILSEYKPGGDNRINNIKLAAVLDRNDNMPSNSTVRDFLLAFMADHGMNMDYFKNNRLDNTYKRAITDYLLRRTFIELNCDAEKDY